MNRLTAVTKEKGDLEARWRQEVAAEKKLEVETNIAEKKTEDVSRQLAALQTDLATAKTGYADTRAQLEKEEAEFNKKERTTDLVVQQTMQTLKEAKADQEFKQKYLEEEAESDRKEMAEAKAKLAQVEAAEKDDARQHAEKLQQISFKD